MVTLDSPIRIAPEVLDQEVQGESVLLHLGNESYFGLNPLGTVVWQRIQAGMTLRQIHRWLLDAYAVEAEQLERDLLLLIADLHRAGLILLVPPGDCAA